MLESVRVFILDSYEGVHERFRNKQKSGVKTPDFCAHATSTYMPATSSPITFASSALSMIITPLCTPMLGAVISAA